MEIGTISKQMRSLKMPMDRSAQVRVKDGLRLLVASRMNQRI